MPHLSQPEGKPVFAKGVINKLPSLKPGKFSQKFESNKTKETNAIKNQKFFGALAKGGMWLS